MSAIAPVFIEIHDNSLDVALFTVPNPEVTVFSTHSLRYFRHNKCKLVFDSVIVSPRLPQYTWNLTFAIIKWLTFSIISTILIKKPKYLISYQSSLRDCSLNLSEISNRNTQYNVMGVKRHIMPVDLPQSVSISGAEINLTFRTVSTCVLCCNLAESKSVLKMCFSKHCHEVTGFLLWFGTYCISCVVQQRNRVKDLFSLVGYYYSCLAAIRHDKSIIRVLQPRPDMRSQSVLFWLGSLGDNFFNSLSFRELFWNIYSKLFLSLWDILRTKRTACCEPIGLNTKTGKYVTTWALPSASSLIFDEICAEQHGWTEDNKNEFQFGSICRPF